MNDKEIRRHLERWDPAADHEPPPALRQRIATRLDEQRAEARAGLARGWALAAVAGLAAVLIAVLALRFIEPRPTATVAEPVIDPRTAQPPIQMVYTASNGVRIYWTVPLESGSRN